MPRLFIAVYLSCCYLAVCAQPRSVQTYTVSDGLAQSQVYALLADSRGFLWAGTQGGGLSRFDGQKFQTFSDADGLLGNNVSALWEDAEGQIWVGTDGGLSRYDGTGFKSILPEKEVLDITGDEASTWVLTTEKIYFTNNEGEDWKEITFPKPYLQVYCVLHEQNRMLLGTDRGAWSWQNEEWTELKGKYNASHQIWSMYRYLRGQSWALAPGGQFFSIQGDSLVSRKVPARNPTVFYVSEQGDSWLGTQGQGLLVLPKGGREWLPIQRKDGLGSNHVRAITGDRWGNIWVGTSGGGLSCIRYAPFAAFDQNRGLPDREVYALSEVDSQGVFFTLANHGIYWQTESGPVAHLSDPELSGEKIKSMARDERGWWWMGTPGNGIKVHTDSSWVTVDACGKYILDLLPAGKDSWWVATAYEGLSLLRMQEDSTGLTFRCQTFGREHELPIGRIESLQKDQQGRLLIAYRELGLACWEPNILHWQITRKEGLPSNTVRAVRQDSIGYYWLATARGLVRAGETPEGMRLAAFQNKDGLQSNNLYCLAFTSAQELWVGSERGMDRITLDAARNIREVNFYGAEEGFTGIETCTDAALADRKGNLWVGTMNGLMLYENKPVRVTRLAPPLLSLAGIQLSYRPAAEVLQQPVLDGWGSLVVPRLELAYHQNQIRVELTAQDLAQPQDVRYEWRLAGWEEAWTPPSEQRIVSYVKLPPGAYTFMARAVGEGNRKSDVIQLPIDIIPAFWQTSWFRGAVIGGIVLLLSLLLWRIFHRRLKRQRRVAEGLRLENRLLELEQKALQLQMNPHFLANALQGIQYELNEGAYKRASEYLTKFGALMRSTLYHSRASKITLSDEIENLQHYLELEQFRTGARFSYHFEIPANLEVDLIEIPPMLLQPFLENAVHHGMRNKQGDGRITVTFAEEGPTILLVSIEDNGPGLAASRAKRSSDHQSTALKVIKERLELLEHTTVATPYQIKEIVAEDQVKGVIVKVRIPV
ncbi:two-component regulator propeller domain-containing protein [Lewinella cohaerens]|uniref:two-component regulator propeller domain-containing protein n=1 Tax=Lewinella cohaerens TaxID=70995 RepID=UPI00036B245A|nr:two-component regulator propeller domain-containing protein [Lewinella cohaerens]